MKERIHWIDIAKGLMIIGMVLNHIPNYCNRMGVDITSFANWWYLVGGAYGAFTMQSFFILSGYTSNFNIGVKSFLWKQFKGLIIPYISFTLICFIIDHFLTGKTLTSNVFGEDYSFFVESYWFLTALFIAKVLMYFLDKLFRNKYIELGGGILLLVIGLAISELYSGTPEPSHWHNWFHYRNGLCMAVFLPIGYFMKKYKIVDRYGLAMGVAYCVVYYSTFLMSVFDIPNYQYLTAPGYTHYLVPNLNDVNGFLLIPSYLFYTVFGSVGIFWICQKIRHNKLLEYFGSTSLIVYCVHFSFLTLFVKFVSPLIPHEGIISAGFLFIIIAVLTLGTSALAAYLFEKKPLKYFIGKF